MMNIYNFTFQERFQLEDDLIFADTETDDNFVCNSLQ